jgi:hypothetical protein
MYLLPRFCTQQHGGTNVLRPFLVRTRPYLASQTWARSDRVVPDRDIRDADLLGRVAEGVGGGETAARRDGACGRWGSGSDVNNGVCYRVGGWFRGKSCAWIGLCSVVALAGPDAAALWLSVSAVVVVQNWRIGAGHVSWGWDYGV